MFFGLSRRFGPRRINMCSGQPTRFTSEIITRFRRARQFLLFSCSAEHYPPPVARIRTEMILLSCPESGKNEEAGGSGIFTILIMSEPPPVPFRLGRRSRARFRSGEQLNCPCEVMLSHAGSRRRSNRNFFFPNPTLVSGESGGP